MQYIEFKGKKFPFIITMSTLVEFKKTKGIDFELALSGDISNIYETMLLLTILALNKGFQIEKPPFYKIIWNLITTRSKIGINRKDYIKLLDLQYTEISNIIPSFFGDVSEEDKKK